MLVSLHVKVPHTLRRHLKHEAKREGLPLSIYVRRLLIEVAFNQIARLQGEITDAKQKA